MYRRLVLCGWQVRDFKDFAPKVPNQREVLERIIVSANGDKATIQDKLAQWHETGKVESEDDAWVSTKKKAPKVRDGCHGLARLLGAPPRVVHVTGRRRIGRHSDYIVLLSRDL